MVLKVGDTTRGVVPYPSCLPGPGGEARRQLPTALGQKGALVHLFHHVLTSMGGACLRSVHAAAPLTSQVQLVGIHSSGSGVDDSGYAFRFELGTHGGDGTWRTPIQHSCTTMDDCDLRRGQAML